MGSLDSLNGAYLIHFFVLLLLIIVSLAFSVRQCSRLREAQQCRRRDAIQSAAVPDIHLDARNLLKECHRQAYGEIRRDVNELRCTQAQVHKQLGALRRIMTLVKEQTPPRASALQKDD